MSWAAKIKEQREKLGKATQDAQKLAPKPGDTVTTEQHSAFIKARNDAFSIGQELQRMEAAESLETLDQMAAGNLEPELSTRLLPGFTGRADGYVQVPVDPEMHARVAQSMGRILTPREHLKRYGITREQHSTTLDAFLRAPTRSTGYREAEEALRELLGQQGGAEKHLHSVVDDGLGGFTVGEDFRAQLIRARAGFTVGRSSGMRVIQTSKPIVSYPVVNRAATNAKQYSSDMNQGDGNWRQEGATSGGTARTPQSKPTFGLENIPVHIWQPDPVELTQELLDDTDVDLMGLLAELIGETLGMDEDVAFLRGNGVNKPEGLLNSGATEVVVGDASTYATPTTSPLPDNGFSYQRIIDIFVSLAAQYRQRAVWYMNSDTFGRLLGLAGSDGHPLFPVNAIPGTLMTRPMFFTEFLDSGSSTSNKPILFGDPRYYVIAERRALYVTRLVERYAPNIALQPTARVGGQLVLKDAFRIGSVQA